MRNQSMFLRLTSCLLVLGGVYMLSSLNISFILIIVPSVWMMHHKLLISQSDSPLPFP
jgi:hypothetical protein